MISTKRQEEISLSYINAVSAVEGIALTAKKHDDDGIDIFLHREIRRADGNKINVSIAAQLKSTAQEISEKENVIKYPLKVKNYNDLCGKATTKQLLFVLFMPQNESEWLEHSIDELIIRKCMYWIDLTGGELSDNSSTVTLDIPKQNFISPTALLEIFNRTAEEM